VYIHPHIINEPASWKFRRSFGNLDDLVAADDADLAAAGDAVAPAPPPASVAPDAPTGVFHRNKRRRRTTPSAVVISV